MNLLRPTSRPLELLIDRLLDPVYSGTDLRERLAGRRLSVEVTDLGYSFLLTFHQLGVRLDLGSKERGDLILRGRLRDFTSWVWSFKEPTLQFEGDLGFSRTLGDLARHLPRERDFWFKATLGERTGLRLFHILHHGASFFQKNAAQLAGLTRNCLEWFGFGVSLERFAAWRLILKELAERMDALENLVRSNQLVTPPSHEPE